jgi:hypothetical protein
MRRIALLLALLALVLPAHAQQPAPARPAPLRELTVANETDQVLQELYVFLRGTEEGADRLGANVLPPRAALRVPLGRSRDCAVALRAVLADGEEMLRRVNLCQTQRVRLADTGPRRDFEIVNDGDADLRELYLSPPDGRERGRDRLGSGIVSAGDTLRIRLRGRECVFDAHAVFADGTEQRRQRVDLCRAPRLAFGDAGVVAREVTVQNRSRRAMRELYARRRGEAAWGADRLGASILDGGGSFRLRIRAAECHFDVRAVYEDDREAIQPGLDLCLAPGIAFDGPVLAGGAPRQLRLVNGFGRIVERIFLSPAEQRGWGEDSLGSEVLAPGGHHDAKLVGSCRADLRIVFDTSAAEERRGIDVCGITAITLQPGWTIAESLAGPAPAPPPGRLRVRNAAAQPVVALFADPSGAERGVNRLGETLLGIGAAMEFIHPADTQCRIDVIAVFGDGRELRMPDHDACAGTDVILQ